MYVGCDSGALLLPAIERGRVRSILTGTMRKQHLIGAALFLIAFFGWTILYEPALHPSDQQMIEYFNDHRSDFEHLASIAVEDTYTKQSILREIKWVTMRSGRVKMSSSVVVSPQDDLEAIIIEKGYMYSLTEPTPLVDSLDAMNFDSRGTHYRRISEHWYLYHEWGVSKPE